MNLDIDVSWKRVSSEEFKKEYFVKLFKFIKDEYATKTIYPKQEEVFKAFNSCPFDKVKVVIVGQDPYHDDGQANGLSFSVNDGVVFPPSLRNIFKELENDLGVKPPASGNLERWAKQGVFLLNATLTVEAHKAGSHQNRGWEEFTDAVISLLAEQRENLVFILWGAYAQRKGLRIGGDKHLVLKSAHPSPLSAYRGFFGNNHFRKTNDYLIANGIEPVEW